MAHIVIYSPDMKIIKDINVSKNSPITSNEVDEQGNAITKTENPNSIVDDFNITFGNGYLELVVEEKDKTSVNPDYGIKPPKIVRKMVWGNMPYFVQL